MLNTNWDADLGTQFEAIPTSPQYIFLASIATIRGRINLSLESCAVYAGVAES